LAHRIVFLEIGGKLSDLFTLLERAGQGRGVAPRSAPNSFVMPQKSQQKKAPGFLAYYCLWQKQVPFIQQKI